MIVNGKEYPLFYGGLALEKISQYARANNMTDINSVMLNAGLLFQAQVAFVGITEYCRINKLECDIVSAEQVLDGIKKITDLKPALDGYLEFAKEFYHVEDSEGESQGAM